MSDAPEVSSAKPVPGKEGAASAPDQIFLVSYPKIIFFYPTLIASLLCGTFMLFAADEVTQGTTLAGWLFLLVFAVNFVVISFDFPRTTSLTFFFVGVAAVLAGILLVIYLPDVLPAVENVLRAIQPRANATFYFTFAVILILIYVSVFISVRFDYWEVRPNELLHHHGILSDLERFAAPNLRIDKEINDIFEYILLRSGRLILHPNNERRAIVLENVIGITRKEKDITRMLGALQVQVRSDQSMS